MLLYNTELELFKTPKGKKSIIKTADYEVLNNTENNKIEVICKEDNNSYWITNDMLESVSRYIVKEVKPFVVDCQQPPQEELTHLIMRGQSILHISQIYNTTIENIKKLNPHSNFNMGEVIRVK